MNVNCKIHPMQKQAKKIHSLSPKQIHPLQKQRIRKETQADETAEVGLTSSATAECTSLSMLLLMYTLLS